MLVLDLLCPQNPAKRFHTKFHTGFHFEFHYFKEETLFIATPQSHFVRQLPVNGGAFWGTLCAKIYELTLWLEQGRLTHCRSQFSLFLPVLRFAYSSTGRAQLRTSRSDCFNGVTGSPGGRGRFRFLPLGPPGNPHNPIETIAPRRGTALHAVFVLHQKAPPPAGDSSRARPVGDAARFGVERVLWTSKRNGERAGTGRITNGSE